ncbi:hypothetical protein F0562_022439 [Nyssa sinensis]|uniref:GDSL esterase/lipase n=1 Tax=Nyssa sinensis TaxID=561372 RepID=A0A5J5BRR9_9ASTE|nr:hypothetical protein F0562_022439 [Nyssa sinensis]
MWFMMDAVYGDVAMKPSSGSSSITSMYVLGDSSVDCGDNTLFYPFLRHNLSLYPCDGSDTSLLPHLLAEHMGLPYASPFYSQNGSIEGLLQGVNFGSAQATIMNPISPSHQSLNQQLRQAFETVQLLQLQLGQETANHFIQSSLFYLSFGKDDYINLFLQNSSGLSPNYNGQKLAHILVEQMTHAIKTLYDANVRKIVCMGILPLGCTPRVLWEGENSRVGDGGSACEEEINELVVEYNIMLEDHIVDLNVQLADAHIIFCDVYQGIVDIITYPKDYGFKDVKSACCGLGKYGGMLGCVSVDMACQQVSAHVWWDFYNPTQSVNSLLAKSIWSGQPLSDICRPITIHELP